MLAKLLILGEIGKSDSKEYFQVVDAKDTAIAWKIRAAVTT